MKSTYPALCVGTLFAVLALVAVDAYSCTRVFWNSSPDLMIVGRTEDYVTASHPSFVATPRGVQRWDTADETKRHQSISWTVKYGNVAIYENNRFPNDGMNQAGLTARTLYYLEGDPNANVIDGAGRVLMPGLIESHAHLSWAAVPMADLQHSLPGYEQVVATAQARNILMRGVTSVLDS